MSKVWDWEVWWSAIWGVRCHARGKWDCESVRMLFFASKGDEIEGWKERERERERERGEKMREAKDP